MNSDIKKHTLNSFEFDAELAKRNENIIRSMYAAFIQQNQALPLIDDLVEFVRVFNMDIIARQLGLDRDSDEVAREYEALEDHNMFCMMGSYIRTVITKSRLAILDSVDELIQNGILGDTIHRTPDVVVYGDKQQLVFSQFAKMGVSTQGNVMNVRQEGIPYLGLGEGHE